MSKLNDYTFTVGSCLHYLHYSCLQRQAKRNDTTIMINVIKSDVSCLYHGHFLLACQVGVRQEENLSPMLFAIYLSDLEAYLSQRCTGLASVSQTIAD